MRVRHGKVHSLVAIFLPPGNDAVQELRFWWARPESNRHGLRRGILSALCIPIPPLALVRCAS